MDTIFLNKQEGKKIQAFQVFGERCSGTNYTETLIAQTFPDLLRPCLHWKGEVCVSWRHGWKHGFPMMPLVPPDTLFICVFRHPEVWLRHIHKKPWHVPVWHIDPDFSEFIRKPWITVAENDGQGATEDSGYRGLDLQWDRHPVTGRIFDTVIDMRNAKNAGWMSLVNRGAQCIGLRFEDVVDSGDRLADLLEAQFGLKPTRRIRRLNTYKGRKTQTAKQSNFETLTTKDHDFVWAKLNQQTERVLGYEPLPV